MIYDILLVDGDQENLELLEDALKYDHLVRTAENELKADFWLRSERFDIVMANEKTSGMPGLLEKRKRLDTVVKAILITDDPMTTKPLHIDALLRYPPPEGTTMKQVVEQAIKNAFSR